MKNTPKEERNPKNARALILRYASEKLPKDRRVLKTK
jgi:hypothetical protein